MSYFLNKSTLAVIIGIVFIVVMTINEVAQLTSKVKANNITFYREWINRRDDQFSAQEECQNKTVHICEFIDCSVPTPDGSPNRLCDGFFKRSWKATNIPIPELYRNIEIIRLTTIKNENREELELLPRVKTLNFRIMQADGTEPVNSSKPVPSNDIIRVVNKMILYDLSNVVSNQPRILEGETAYQFYIASNDPPIARSAMAQESNVREQTIECSESLCPRNFLDIVSLLTRLRY